MKKITAEKYIQIAEKIAPQVGSLSFNNITKINVDGALIINTGNAHFANDKALKLIGISTKKKSIRAV